MRSKREEAAAGARESRVATVAFVFSFLFESLYGH
jgi:hypothetical protein